VVSNKKGPADLLIRWAKCYQVLTPFASGEWGIS
jgi:hypothetical protein